MSQHMTSHYRTVELTEQLAQARRLKGLTQAALGDRLGIPQSHISKIEQGKSDLRLSSLLDLARQLDLEVLLVPKRFLPAIRSITAAKTNDATSMEADGQFLYRLRKHG